MTKEEKQTNRILIVEDDSSLLQLLSSKLQSKNFEVIRAQDGKIGLEKALKEHPDLILLDIIMPVMDGLTMLKELRKDKWGKKAKVIILTNLTEAGTTEKASEEGVYDFLVKSNWRLDDLVNLVNEKLST